MNVSNVPYVIVQAGGRGSRLAHLTHNKPKCLLSIDGQSLLYRLMSQWQNSRYIVIGDYQYGTLKRYLNAVPPPAPHTLVRASGFGNIAGLRAALARLPQDTPFVVVWCDLYFQQVPNFDIEDRPLVGLTGSFPCRWSWPELGEIQLRTSEKRGICGFFAFPSKRFLEGLPYNGELVEYLQGASIGLKPVEIPGVREFGTLASVRSHEGRQPTRFFNEVSVGKDVVVKRARLPEYEGLLATEADWYARLTSSGFAHTPHLYRRKPLTMRRIVGRHPHELDLNRAGRREVLSRIIAVLDSLHGLGSRASSPASTRAMYWEKTADRLSTARKVVPGIDRSVIRINDRLCRNPLSSKYGDWYREKVGGLGCDEYVVIHGDPTFSNIIVDEHRKIWLIDPRGRFGHDFLFGEPRYDWAKLWYSVTGNYDQFNLSRFELTILSSSVTLTIAPNGWRDTAGLVHEHSGMPIVELETLHALIWLALSGWVLDDFDAICAAFYQGVYRLELSEA